VGRALALAGRRAEALDEAATLEAMSAKQYVSPHSIALIYAALDDRARALDWLEKAADDRSSQAPFMKADRRLQNIREEPRFHAILQRMRLE
jgi:hypothetical protein